MSLNKVQLIGNLCQDPSIKTFDTEKKVATFSVATSDKAYKLKNGTEVPEKTEFHNIVIWGKLAEVVEKYLHKGDKVYLEGKIRTRNYEDKNGAKRYATEIFVDNLEMLSTKRQEAQPASTPPQVDAEPIVEGSDLPF